MAGKITDRDMGMKRLAKLLAAPPRQVVVGIRQGDGGGERVKTVGEPGSRRSVAGDADDPTLAEVAAKNEFGLDGNPERSFMRSTFDAKNAEYQQIMATGIGRYIDGDDNLETVLGVVGLRVVDDVQEAITTISTPPNSEATIEAKGSSNPLIDSGRMRQAIGYELREGGK